MNNQEMSSNTQVLWGTNINTFDISQQLQEFLTTFTVIPDDENVMEVDDGRNDMERFNHEPYYIQKLK